MTYFDKQEDFDKLVAERDRVLSERNRSTQQQP
jgi:hypothetical protein